LEQERARQEAEAKAREDARRLAEAEEAAWQQARDSNTEAAFKHFVDGYPKSARVPEARRSIETLAWQQAVRQDKAAAYADFVQRFPGSNHAEEANQTLSKLQKYEALRKNISGSWDFKLKDTDTMRQTLNLTQFGEKLTFRINTGLFFFTAEGTYVDGVLDVAIKPIADFTTYKGQLTRDCVIEGEMEDRNLFFGVISAHHFTMTKTEQRHPRAKW
jgi:hypothetical protein